MHIRREILKKNNSEINKSKIRDIKYGRVSIDITHKGDSFKSDSHIIGHKDNSIAKRFKVRENSAIAVKGETKIEGNVKADMEVSSDSFMINPALRAATENTAGIETWKEANFSGLHLDGKFEAGLQANADAGVEGVFHVSSKECEFGFKLADRIEFGTYEGVRLAASTSRGSDLHLNVKLEQGPQLGGAIGAGLKIDREAIHGRLELDGNFGLFGTDLKASFTLRYDDVKHAVDKVVNAVIAGPLGIIASRIFHRAEQEDKLQGKETPQKEYNKGHDVKNTEDGRPSDVKKTEDKDSNQGEDISVYDAAHGHFKWQRLRFDD
ncbi:MAG: hypothetical protein ABRQ37_06585 [Candidatus Eremiobacterota bacterium]